MSSSSRAPARRVLPLALVLAGCTADAGPASDWFPVNEASGALAATLSLSPPVAMMKPLAGERAREPLRVVSYNVEYGEEVDELVALFRDDAELAKAGVVLLQESEAHPEEGEPRAKTVADRLGMAYVYVPTRVKDGYTDGLAILSRHPTERVDQMLLPLTDVDHQRIAVRADIRVGDVTLQVINVHLSTTLNRTERVQQLRPAVIEPPDLVLVAGDLNTNEYLWGGGDAPLPVLPAATIAGTDQAPLVDELMRRIGYDTPSAAWGHTEELLGIGSRLDSIYTRGAGVLGGGVRRDVRLSDHFPLWIDLQLP